MNKKILLLTTLIFAISFSCVAKSKKGETKMNVSKNWWKHPSNANPLLANVFCADPTSVEYEGRLYVYGTNDHEQYQKAEKNTYEKIKSLVCFSTADMQNWTFHGEINVGKIAPWIINSWAPSICSRKEADGLTHFYLYFSNNGTGVGVITATSPLGPWTSPLNHSLVSNETKGLKDCPNPFDPGVCIDENGVGWLSFGAGISKNGTKEFPGSARIVKLGDDMISLASDFVEIKAPYLFEASELNFINGTYVYTFNNSWDERTTWTTKTASASSACSMSYMTTKTPLDTESWVYEGQYFKNPGEMNLNYSNNHTHLQKFNEKWYLFYHTLTLQEKSPTKGGFRSICVDEIEIDEENVKIKNCKGTRNGVNSIKNLDPFENIPGTTFSTCADIWYDDIENPNLIATKSTKGGSWIFVKNVDFSQKNASKIVVNACGTGKIYVFANKLPKSIGNGLEPIAEINVKNDVYKEISEKINSSQNKIHNLYFVFSTENLCLKNWHFE